jgi:hypothetical protein
MTDLAEAPVEIVVKFAVTTRDIRTFQPTYEPVVETFASTAVFGRSMAPSDPVSKAKGTGLPKLPFMGLNQQWLPVHQPIFENRGCEGALYTSPQFGTGFIALVQRGDCAFFEKLVTAKQQGALGVVVWGSEGDAEQLIRPSAEGDPVQEVDDVGIVYIPHEAGKAISDSLTKGEEMSVVFAAVEYDELDMTSLADLLAQQQEELEDILKDLQLDHLAEALESNDADSEVPDVLAEALESMDTTKKRLASHSHATEPSAATEPERTPVPANVVIVGLPITNLFIIPPR